MRFNCVDTVCRDVKMLQKHKILLNDQNDDNNMRFMAFDFNYKGKKGYITARYEIGTEKYENITMDAGFDRPASQNNYYSELVGLISHLRKMFSV